MNILQELLKKYPTGEQLSAAFGSAHRQTGLRWIKERRLPAEHWDKAMELLPGLTIEECYDQFVRRQRRKQKSKKH